VPTAIYNPTTSGGILVDGTSETTGTIAGGGLSVNGTADTSQIFLDTMMFGGLFSTGTSDYLCQYIPEISSGTIVTGKVDFSAIFLEDTSIGVVLGRTFDNLCVFESIPFGGATLSGTTLNAIIDIVFYGGVNSGGSATITTGSMPVSSGTIRIGGCSGYRLDYYLYYAFAIGSILYSKKKAMNGKYERICIKDVRFSRAEINAMRLVAKGWYSVPLYIDTLNGYWNEEELVNYDDATNLIWDYHEQQKKLAEKLAFEC
jgi:hypothetical protein